MIKIEFVKDKIPFTQVANGVLTDKRLSAKAKGLYAYLYSKPDGWDFAIDRIALEMADGRKSINEGLKELEALGFLTRKRQSDGRVLYLVHFPPIEPNAQNGQEDVATCPKSHMTKMGTVSNKDIKVIKKEHSEASSQVFNWEKYLQGMLDHDRKDLNIIGFFFKAKGVSFNTKEKAEVAIRRHLKPAKELKPFDKAEIGDKIRKLNYDFPKFTLETVIKELIK